MTEAELSARASRYTLTTAEADAWETIREIDYLLGDDADAA